MADSPPSPPNQSEEIINMCVTSHPFVAECVRASILSFLSLVTLIIVCIQLFRIIKNTRRFLSYQVVMLYIGLGLSFLCFLKFFFIPYTWFIFILLFIKEILLLWITYSYLYYALRLFKKKKLIARLLWPATALDFVALLATLGVALSGVTESTSECGDPAFLILSGIGMFNATLFLIFGGIIHYRLTKVHFSKSIANRKRRELWSLIIVFFIVALTSYSWDMGAFIYSNVKHKCNIFEWNSGASAFFTGLERVVDLLLPLWCMCIILEVEARKKRAVSVNHPSLKNVNEMNGNEYVEEEEEEYDDIDREDEEQEINQFPYVAPSSSYYSVYKETIPKSDDEGEGEEKLSP